jgi:hypothetical protein
MSTVARHRRLAARLGLAVAIASSAGVAIAEQASASVAGPTVFAYGSAGKFKGPAGPLNAPIIAIASNPAANGYWSLSVDGGVFTSGNAEFFGAPTGPTAGFTIDIAPTPTGRGYWVTTALGAVYHYGDARWRGSARDEHLTKPIVGIAPTATGNGYWLAAEDGRVFAYGDAVHLGNATTLYVPPKIVDIVATPSGDGYALLDASGWVFAFGDALVMKDQAPTNRPARALGVARDGKGYWVLGANGAIARYNSAPHLGDPAGQPITAIDLAITGNGGGYWIATGSPFPALPPNSGEGRRVVYANGAQRIWLVESNGIVVNSFRVSGRLGAPPPGTYAIASKSEMSSAGSLRLPYMSRFYRASSGKWIGFHGIPLRPDGTPIQTDAQLGQPLSHGCVRMNQEDVKVVWAFTPIGTKVVVTP